MVRAALVVAGVAVLIRAAGWVAARSEDLPPVDGGVASGAAVGQASAPMAGGPCPPRTIPDQGACVPVSALDPIANPTLAGTEPQVAADHVPLRPDRPADPARYRWPLPIPAAGLAQPSFPLEPLSPVAVAIPVEAEAVVRAVQLEGQVGDAEILWTGELVGTTAVTLHTVRGSGGLRSFILIHGGLAGLAPGLLRGANLKAGAELGTLPLLLGELMLEAREVRAGIDVKALPSNELRHSARTIPCDLRNLLEQIP